MPHSKAQRVAVLRTIRVVARLPRLRCCAGLEPRRSPFQRAVRQRRDPVHLLLWIDPDRIILTFGVLRRTFSKQVCMHLKLLTRSSHHHHVESTAEKAVPSELDQIPNELGRHGKAEVLHRGNASPALDTAVVTNDREVAAQEFERTEATTAHRIAAPAIRINQTPSAELYNMTGVLARTFSAAIEVAEHSRRTLDSIDCSLLEPVDIDDIRTVHRRLSSCTNSLRDELLQQKHTADLLAGELYTRVQPPPQSLVTECVLDHATGLPRRTAAEVAFSSALESHRKHFIVTIVMNRLPSINARFGNNVGDRMLFALRRQIEAALVGEEDQSFRWTGPALVVLLPRDLQLNYVRSMVRRVIQSLNQEEFDVGDSNILIPLSVSWSVIALIPPALNAAKYIERFVASQIPSQVFLT